MKKLTNLFVIIFVTVYLDENALIAKNSSLIIVRVPLSAQQKRAW